MGFMKLIRGVGIMLLVTAYCMLGVNSMRWSYNWTDPAGGRGGKGYDYGGRGGGGWGWWGGYGHGGRGYNYSSGGSPSGGGWGWSGGDGHNYSAGGGGGGGGGSSPRSGGGGWGWSGGYGHNYSTGGGGGGGGGSSPRSGGGEGSGWGWWGGWGGDRGFNYTYGEGGGRAPPVSPPPPTPRGGPGRIVVGGDSQGWNFGFNYSDWAIKNSPFYFNDVLVFKYEPPRNGSHPHSVYMLPDESSYQKCDLSKGRRLATPTQGIGDGFEFVLRRWQPYYFACGESNGFHCSAGMMKFSVTPTFSWK